MSGNIKDAVIKFQAQVSKVTTLADGGLRVVLDLSETDIETAKSMMQAKQQGAFLEIAAVPIKSDFTWSNE
jgi:predicted transcriptional regulator